MLYVELAQEAQGNAPRVVAPKRNSVIEVEQAILGRVDQPAQAGPL